MTHSQLADVSLNGNASCKCHTTFTVSFTAFLFSYCNILFTWNRQGWLKRTILLHFWSWIGVFVLSWNDVRVLSFQIRPKPAKRGNMNLKCRCWFWDCKVHKQNHGNHLPCHCGDDCSVLFYFLSRDITLPWVFQSAWKYQYCEFPFFGYTKVSEQCWTVSKKRYTIFFGGSIGFSFFSFPLSFPSSNIWNNFPVTLYRFFFVTATPSATGISISQSCMISCDPRIFPSLVDCEIVMKAEFL